MNVIPGATLLDQLNAPTSDGLPDENANDNCVPTSIAEGLHILTGGSYNPDELKDAVYGQGVMGFQSAANYVSYCAARGVTLSPHNDTQAGLVSFIHQEVQAGHPVIVTMPSQWGTAPANPVSPSGSTHVGVAVGEMPGSLRVMNPWHAFWQDQSDAWWQARLCYGQVWRMQKVAGTGTMSGVPAGWSDNGTTLTAPNGVKVIGGIRAFVLSNGWDANDAPVAPESYPSVVEVGNPGLGTGAVQFFLKSGQVSWTPAHGVFRTYNGQEEVALHQALDAANVRANDLSGQVSAANATASQAKSDAAAAQAQATQAQAAAQAATAARDAALQAASDAQAQLAALQASQSAASVLVADLKHALGLSA